ncbi:hypothetical protein KP79_PYT24239 [Mizuhopecten yessoensis]|uniref:Uncharacterized protein n=1 Tax=Mizuhopecten yessoensis TaxID=6573 RepID=A0A210QR84_MIZYE|nr:hypothetical protein KP79_PYT24239 [Mizuhopecten yessoensis]
MVEVRRMAVNGIRKGNYIEQYSRRNNIKVMDVAKIEDEEEENRKDIDSWKGQYGSTAISGEVCTERFQEPSDQVKKRVTRDTEAGG